MTAMSRRRVGPELFIRHQHSVMTITVLPSKMASYKLTKFHLVPSTMLDVSPKRCQISKDSTSRYECQKLYCFLGCSTFWLVWQDADKEIQKVLKQRGRLVVQSTI